MSLGITGFKAGGSAGGGGCSCCGEHPPCECFADICVFGCPNGTPYYNSTVTVQQDGNPPGNPLPCLPSPLGGNCCRVCIGKAGQFLVTVTDNLGNYNNYSQVLQLSCGSTTNVQLTPIEYPPACWTINVFGCCGEGLPFAQVQIGGILIITDDTGYALWCPPNNLFQGGMVGWIVSAPSGCDRFLPQMGFVDISPDPCQGGAGGSIVATLEPVPSFICGIDGPYPTGPTIEVVDPVFGDVTLTYDPVNSWYQGQKTTSVPPAPNCPAPPDGFNFSIQYTVGVDPTVCATSLAIFYTGWWCGSCQDGFLFANGYFQPIGFLTPAPIPCIGGPGADQGLGNPGSVLPEIGFLWSNGAAGGTEVGCPSCPFACEVFLGSGPGGEICGGNCNPSTFCPCAIWGCCDFSLIFLVKDAL